jgi:hypothetical protein
MANVFAYLGCMAGNVAIVNEVIGTSQAVVLAIAMAVQMSVRMRMECVCSAGTILEDIIVTSVAVVTMVTHHPALPLGADLACVLAGRAVATSTPRLAN